MRDVRPHCADTPGTPRWLRGTRAVRRPRRLFVAGLVAAAMALGMLPSVGVGAAAAATCPCSLFASTQAPAVPSAPDPSAVELGVKFRSDHAGFITGVRFYKGSGNTGTHTGSLWNSAGTRLSTVTFTAETASGWQQANFASPVAIAAGTTYVASYLAPDGHYAADQGYFANTGVVSSPLTALQNGVDGGNGVYRYGSSGGFPNSSYQSTNYWIDVVFEAEGADTTQPTVIDRQPSPGATGVTTSNTTVTAAFSEDVNPSTVVMGLAEGSTPVAASTAYDALTRTAALTPAGALSTSTTYTVSLSGAEDMAGNQMAADTWTFTTAASASACPCSLWPSSTVPSTPATADSSAVEVGVKFRTSQAGYVTGIRFYKGTGNTGTHTGSLWAANGTKLASVSFSGETATGWQTATFGAPQSVAADTTYVASYHAPVGRYASTSGYFASAATTRGPLTALSNGSSGGNGVYRYGASGFPNSTYQSTNYWVDVVFDAETTDTIAPTVVARTPSADATGVGLSTPVSARFSEGVTAGSVTMELRRSSDSSLVTATVGYDAPSQTATLTPAAPLQASSGYTATVKDATDAAGNTMVPASWGFTTAAPPPPPPDQGPGGPVAIVTSSSNPYSTYLAEILRTEGLNEFSTVDVPNLSAATLSGFDVVVLGSVTVNATQVTALTDWVDAGGNLIAIKPHASLSSLLGITATGAGPLSDAYLRVDSSTPAGAGIASDTMQFHGPASLYTLSGAQAVATLYSDATSTTTNPAVTLRDVGTSGGQAAAFTYDLPASIVAMRQGNQAWAGQDRDGQAPVRSDDMFFGGPVQDWVDLSKVAVPQADEQQRLLANLIQVTNRDRKPLPRFWYFPRSLKAVVIGTGDDHGNGGTVGRFDQYIANSPAGCSVENWTCLRFSSYVYPNTPALSDAAAAEYTDEGFEVGVHESTGCADFTAASLPGTYANDIAQWQASYPSLQGTPPTTNRTHCIVYSDWSSQPKTELANGMRLDGNYYYWPGSWVQNRPGFMTGSGMPMRFADTDGSMIDVYQAPTQLTDESNQTYPYTPDTLLDNAIGPLGYFGAFTANMHTDAATTPQSDALISSAVAHDVPIVSGRQMVTWLDGRNASSYSGISWSNDILDFTVEVGAGATGLTGMVPTAGPNGTQLTGITRAGVTVSTTTTTVKGIEYASFDAAAGSYSATYAAPSAPPAISSLAVDGGAPTATQSSTLTWATDTVSTSQVRFGTSPTSLTNEVTLEDATRRHLVTAARLKPGVKYFYRVSSTDLSGRTVTHPKADRPPATFTTPTADVTPPKVTSARVTPLPGGIATVRWTTNEPSTAVVQAGENTTAMRDVARADELSTSHALVVSGLRPSTTYSISGVSYDAAANAGRSATLQFVTPAWGISEQGTPTFSRGALSGAAVLDPDELGRVTLSGATTRARSGVYVSVPLDAQQMAGWDRAIWDGKVPAGASAALLFRTGSTDVPDSTWTPWQKMPANGRVAGSSRYLQYQVQLASPAGVTAPSLWAVGFTHNGEEPAHEVEAGSR